MYIILIRMNVCVCVFLKRLFFTAAFYTFEILMKIKLDSRHSVYLTK